MFADIVVVAGCLLHHVTDVYVVYVAVDVCAVCICVGGCGWS